MARRRPAPPPAASLSPHYRVQVLRGDGTSHLPLIDALRLDSTGAVVPGGASMTGAGVELRVQAEGVVARPVGEGGVVRLNEVQLTSPMLLRSGDQLAFGGCSLTLVRVSALPWLGLVRPTWQLEPWLEAVVARAERRGGTVALSEVHAPTGGGVAEESAVLFALGPEACLRLSGGDTAAPGEQRRTLFPQDGAHAPALLAHVLGAEDGGEELPVVREPVMVRLAQLLEHLARLRVPVLLEGEAGVGKALWARRLLQLYGVGPALTVAGAAPGAAAKLTSVLAPALFVEDVDRLPAEAQETLSTWQGAVLVGTTRRPEGMVPALAGRFAHGRVVVPPLRDRPAELTALVEVELGRIRERLRRPGLHLDAQARALVMADAWPGNVDAVKAALWRAARVAVGDGVRPEDLPVRLREEGVRLGVAGAKAAAEKAALLAALVDAGWNVAEASRRMGVPRRTVVHRMSVLGLRRPQQS